MADKSDIYHFRLALVDQACALDEHIKLTLACHPSETLEHCIMRVLAYGLFWQPGLEMVAAVCQGHEPDLAVEQHAIIVGINNHKRIRKAARQHARLTCLEWRPAHIQKAESLCRQIDKDGATATIIGMQGDVAGLLQQLQRRNHWQLVLSESGMNIEIADKQLGFSTTTLCRL